MTRDQAEQLLEQAIQSLQAHHATAVRAELGRVSDDDLKRGVMVAAQESSEAARDPNKGIEIIRKMHSGDIALLFHAAAVGFVSLAIRMGQWEDTDHG